MYDAVFVESWKCFYNDLYDVKWLLWHVMQWKQINYLIIIITNSYIIIFFKDQDIDRITFYQIMLSNNEFIWC